MKILVLIAHPDDEVSCAGLLAKNNLEGGESLILCFTGDEIRHKELKASCKLLKCKLIHFQFDELNIPYNTKLRKKLIEIIRGFKPDISIIQSDDYHLDHQKVNKMALDVLEFAAHSKNGWLTPKILELESSNILPYPDVVFDISKEFPIKKRVFKKHMSQTVEKSFGGYYLKNIQAKAKLRGVLIGTKFGEAYKLHNLSIKGDFYPFSRGFKKIRDLF